MVIARARRTALLLATFAVTCVCAAIACLPDRRTLSASTDDGGSDAGSETGADADCIDPTGFDGRGCYRCPPQTNEQFLNACTKSKFVVFDETRTKGPHPAAPKDCVFDAGSSEATDAGTWSPCPLSDPTENPVMVLGATGFPMDTLALAMRDKAAKKDTATIYYKSADSCDGVASILIGNPTLSGVVDFWDGQGNTGKCTLDKAYAADIGLSALFIGSCGGKSGLADQVIRPSDVEDLVAFNSVIMFAVPNGSVQDVISAEAAYRVYGFANVEPWIDEQFIYRRTPTSGNQTVVARTLGLPPDCLRGQDSGGSLKMRDKLRDSVNPARTIGISSCEIVDTNRNVIHSLAYQHYEQRVGFYPDSVAEASDRRNVRDGHYYLWTPLRVLVKKGNEGLRASAVIDNRDQPARDEAVRALTYVMTNRKDQPDPGVKLFQALKALGNVPECAMRVTRDTEGAELKPFTPERSCACAFEAAGPGPSAGSECQECGGNRPACPTGRNCNFGYCE